MSIAVSKRALSAALGHVTHLTGARLSPGTTRGSVLVESAPDGLTLTVRGDVNAELTVPADVPFHLEPARLVLPAELLSVHVRNAPGEVIHLEFLRHALDITSGSSRVEVHTSPSAPEPDAFAVTFPSEGLLLALSVPDLTLAANAVLYAASHEAFQAVFRGILFEGRESGLRLVASDGYRVATADLPTPPPQPFKAIIHAAHVRELLRLLGGRDTASLQFDGTHLTVRAGGITVSLPYMDGEFPAYERVIPAVTGGFAVPAQALRESVNRVAIMSDKNANNRLELTLAEGRLVLTAHGDYGTGQDVLEVTDRHGDPPAQLAVNARFLQEALAPATGTLRVGLSGSTKPFVLTSDAPGVQGILVTLRA